MCACTDFKRNFLITPRTYLDNRPPWKRAQTLDLNIEHESIDREQFSTFRKTYDHSFKKKMKNQNCPSISRKYYTEFKKMFTKKMTPNNNPISILKHHFNHN